MDFDLVVLGGGSGGYAAALRASQLGLSVALIERDKLGGTCLHRGCIPTKALLHAGEIADNAREAHSFGVKAEFHAMDMAGVNAYKDGVISKLHKGLQGLVKSRNVTYIEGEGRLVSPNTIVSLAFATKVRTSCLPLARTQRPFPDLRSMGSESSLRIMR